MPKGVYIRTDVTKKRMSLWQKGKKKTPFTEEHKRKISMALKVSAPWKGKKMSEEHRKKISEHSYQRGRFGENHSAWKGGKTHHSDGYVYKYSPNHPYKVNNYVLEHRLVMEKRLGRYLRPEEVVHHKGIHYPINSIENKQDNHRDNLQLFANESAHASFHRPPSP